MLELAQAVAWFIRNSQADLPAEQRKQVTVLRYKRQNAEVRVDDKHYLYVEWYKGGARVGNRRFDRDPVTGQFDMEAVYGRVTEIAKRRAEEAADKQRAKEWGDLLLQLQYATKNDKRVSVERGWYDNEAFRVTFQTKDFTAASMVVDWLLSFDYDGTGTAERPSLAGAHYTYREGVWSLRDLMRCADFTDAELDEVVKLAGGMSYEAALGTVTRHVRD